MAAPVDLPPPGGWPIWLAARPQSPVLARGPIRSVGTGAISRALTTQPRIHGRAAYPDRPQAARLMDYRAGRGTAGFRCSGGSRPTASSRPAVGSALLTRYDLVARYDDAGA